MFKYLEKRKLRKSLTIFLLECCDVENRLLKPRSLVVDCKKIPRFSCTELPQKDISTTTTKQSNVAKKQKRHSTQN
jgi:hypothetical protein